jgi:uncharacterized membrane protein YraQ (UPF0718 family)
VYLRYEHQHATAGIRITAAAAAVIGWLPRQWGEKSFGSARLGPFGLAVMTSCVLLLLAGTAVLLIEALRPHGLTRCHYNCPGGDY